ncbi:unnamed protein product [Meloidogyne enterolobii]|uniref:Uncharacterized protein n=1 Tax=Meloidogyne enterolobii TaxID=390850 RepID=A0ACB1AC55_MELEN
MYGKKNFTGILFFKFIHRSLDKINILDQKINDCHSISTCLSQNEIISNKESGYTNVSFTRIERVKDNRHFNITVFTLIVFSQNKEGISSSISLSSGFSPLSSNSNISTTNNNKNINLSYSRLRAPSLGVSGSIIANNQSSDEPENLSKGKKRFVENSSLNSNNTKNGCFLM